MPIYEIAIRGSNADDARLALDTVGSVRTVVEEAGIYDMLVVLVQAENHNQAERIVLPCLPHGCWVDSVEEAPEPS